MTTENNHWVSNLFNNKFVKIPVIVSVWVLALVIIYLGGKILFGYNVKVGSFESNPDKVQPETVIVKSPQYIDTLFANKKTSPETSKPPVVVIKSNEIQEKPSVSKKDTIFSNQTTINGGGDNHVITGNGNKVGVNGDLNVLTEKGLSANELQGIASLVEETRKTYNITSDTICLVTYPMTNKTAYAQLIHYFSDKGYYMYPCEIIGGTTPEEIWVWYTKDTKVKRIKINVGSLL